MHITKTYVAKIISFNAITIIPKVSNVFINSISVVLDSGDIKQVNVEPFNLDEEVSVNVDTTNGVAVVVVASHLYAASNDMDALISVSMSKKSAVKHCFISTTTGRIEYKNHISPVVKIESGSGLIISAKVGVIGYDKNSSVILNETVSIGIGDTREIVVSGGYTEYEPHQIKARHNGQLLADAILFNGKEILSYNDQYQYTYLPKYTLEDVGLVVNENIKITQNNQIVLLNKDVEFVDVKFEMSILNDVNARPVIKYIGVSSQ